MEEERKYCIYKHTNKINGKVYIGQTGTSLKKRWDCGRGYKSCVLFNRAIQKYGWNNFEHEVLYTGLTLEEANQKEVETINQYDATNPSKGYNIRPGGTNSALAESSKLKISAANKGRKVPEEMKKHLSEILKGRVFTEEHRRKISEAEKGRIISEETKQRMRENHADFSGENHPMWGKHFSEEVRKKMSEAQKGEKSHNWGKVYTLEEKKKLSYPVRCVETGDEYYGALEAQRQTGIDNSQISKCCKGKAHTAGGYHWEYVNRSKEVGDGF